MRTTALCSTVVLLVVACKPGSESPTVQQRMKDHDVLAAAARDAIARGDLREAQLASARLAALPVDDTVDARWREKRDAMTVAAARIASSTSLNDAAHDLGVLAKSCADCHTMLGRTWPAVVPSEGQASGVQPLMVRHEWAASRMWDGLAIPSEDAWTAGAHVMAEEPIAPDALTPGKTAVPRVGALEQAVHELGRQAVASGRLEDRARIYGDVMATCADCHQWLGGGPRQEPRDR